MKVLLHQLDADDEPVQLDVDELLNRDTLVDKQTGEFVSL